MSRISRSQQDEVGAWCNTDGQCEYTGRSLARGARCSRSMALRLLGTVRGTTVSEAVQNSDAFVPLVDFHLNRTFHAAVNDLRVWAVGRRGHRVRSRGVVMQGRA